jgi:hypothetical protein
MGKGRARKGPEKYLNTRGMKSVRNFRFYISRNFMIYTRHNRHIVRVVKSRKFRWAEKASRDEGDEEQKNFREETSWKEAT